MMDAWEATANVALGVAINWFVLVLAYGEHITATVVTTTMIGLTWFRSYALRKAFRRWGGQS